MIYWTTETPTVSGWYYFRLAWWDKDKFECAMFDLNYKTVLRVAMKHEQPLSIYDKIEWHGPIKPEDEQASDLPWHLAPKWAMWGCFDNAGWIAWSENKPQPRPNGLGWNWDYRWTSRPTGAPAPDNWRESLQQRPSGQPSNPAPEPQPKPKDEQSDEDMAVCAYCGQTTPKSSALMVQHLEKCTNHPLGAAIRKLDDAENVIAVKDDALRKCEDRIAELEATLTGGVERQASGSADIGTTSEKFYPIEEDGGFEGEKAYSQFIIRRKITPNQEPKLLPLPAIIDSRPMDEWESKNANAFLMSEFEPQPITWPHDLLPQPEKGGEEKSEPTIKHKTVIAPAQSIAETNYAQNTAPSNPAQPDPTVSGITSTDQQGGDDLLQALTTDSLPSNPATAVRPGGAGEKIMRYWLDTEFIENGETIDLVSIGIIAEDGRQYYAVNISCDFEKASDWVKENVISKLGKPDASFWKTPSNIRMDVLKFCALETYGKPEFWGYYADYDWVALCQLFGTMMQLPKGWPMYCRDIKQLCDDLGNPELPKQTGEHNAIEDAKWNFEAWTFLCLKADPAEKQIAELIESREAILKDAIATKFERDQLAQQIAELKGERNDKIVQIATDRKYLTGLIESYTDNLVAVAKERHQLSHQVAELKTELQNKIADCHDRDQLAQQVKELTEDRDLWKKSEGECNLAHDELEKENATLRARLADAEWRFDLAKQDLDGITKTCYYATLSGRNTRDIDNCGLQAGHALVCLSIPPGNALDTVHQNLTYLHTQISFNERNIHDAVTLMQKLREAAESIGHKIEVTK